MLSGVWQSTAAAQPAALATEAADPASDGATAVQEIVVTANKRQQSLLDVGASLAAVSGETLKAQHIVSLSDLATTVPGLSYTPTVRGITPPANFASSVPFEDTYTIPAYALLDLRLGVRGPDDAWSVTLFGKNVLDKYYVTNIATDYDTLARYAGQPATYGVTFAGKFR